MIWDRAALTPSVVVGLLTKEKAPRAGYDPKSGQKPANIAGWFPLGVT